MPAPPVTIAGRAAEAPEPARRGSRWPIALAALGLLLSVAVVNAQTGRRSRPPVPLGEAVQLTVGGVGSAAYRVTADLVVRNTGDEALSVVDFTTIGVAISAVGGLPERVRGGSARTLQLHLEIPRCEGVPGRFGGFDVVVQRGSERAEVGFASQPGTPLYREMAGLTDRICASYRRSLESRGQRAARSASRSTPVGGSRSGGR